MTVLADSVPEELRDAPRVRGSVITLLLLVLPFFGQSFHYLKDVLPLWALSKAFPILSLPLAFRLLKYPHFPMSRQILVSFCWLFLVPSFAAVFYFRQDFFTGLGAQVKLLPLLYFYSFLSFLLLVKPTLAELERGFIVLGIGTIVIVLLLAVLAPESWYSGTYEQGSSPLFSADNRGHRIRMPMFFGIIFFCLSFRRFLDTAKLRWLAAAGIAFGVTLLIVKTRSMIFGMIAIAVLNSFRLTNAWVRLVMLIVAPLALVGLLSIDYIAVLFSSSQTSGLDVRLVTLHEATDFLGIDPLRWLFGVGTISPSSSDSLFSYFDHFFFLADITWVGIVFEYGLLGALLILLFELRGLAFFYRKLGRGSGDFLAALSDYVIYELVVSNLYPLTLLPGESAVIFATFVYAWQSRRMTA